MPRPPSAFLETLPHSTEAEKSVLGAVLIDPEAVYRLETKLQPSDFYDPTFRQIFAAIRELSKNGQPIDLVTVKDQLQENQKFQAIGGTAYLAELAAGVPTASHIDQYAKLVLGYSHRRQLAKLGDKITTLAHDNDQTASDLIETAEQQFLELAQQSTTHRPTSLAEMRSEQFERYTALYEADDAADRYGTRTGIPPLDDLLTAMAPAHLIVLAGRPSMGKTALALDIARNVGLVQNKTVGVFSLEMTKEEVFDRVFGSIANIEPWKLTKGLFTQDEFNTLGSAFDRLSDDRIYVDDDPDRSLVTLRSKARRLHMEHKLDLLIIDYLQLIQVPQTTARENQTQRMSFISQSVKQLARELQCPILALSQLNRECEKRPDKRPLLSDLRDSGSIEQDADRVLMLYRDSYYDEDVEEPELTDLYVRKNRHGPTGHCELTFDAAAMTFRR
jgi:replicative DNA helicase